MRKVRSNKIKKEKEEYERDKQLVAEMKIKNQQKTRELEEADKKLREDQQELRQNLITLESERKKLSQERDLLVKSKHDFEDYK